MRYFKFFPFIVFFFFVYTTCFAQHDTSFWFVAPETSAGHSDRPIRLCISTSDQESDIIIRQPANLSFAPITATIPANTTQFFDLTASIESIENKPANTVLNYGLKITGTSPVFVYYDQHSTFNPEMFSLKGQNALGTSFMIPMQTYLDIGAGLVPEAYAGFDIVATEDNTVVTITPTQDLVGHPADIPFTITLNEGQTYFAQAVSQLAFLRPAGTIVTSNKPIAITVKDDTMSGMPFGGCGDLGGDQIIPVSMLGNEYILVRGFLNAPYDAAFIMATQDGTDIYVNNSLITSLNAGQTYQYNMGNADAAYITSSDPISVFHLSGFGCEVSLSILPSVHCTGSRSVSVSRSSSESFYLTMLTDSAYTGGFLFNGAAGFITASQFNTVPATNGQWKYARIELSLSDLPVGGIARIDNTLGVFHMGVIQGGVTSGCSYGYFSDYNQHQFNISVLNNDSILCLGELISLSVNNIPNSVFTWAGPNGFIDSLIHIEFPSTTTAQSGWYSVNGFLEGCAIIADSVYIQINPLPPLDVSGDTIVCMFDTVLFSASGGASYQWYGPNSFTDTCSTLFFIASQYSQAGQYYVTATSNSGCQKSSYISLLIHPLPEVMTTTNAPVCAGDTLFLYTSGGQFFSWTGSGGYSCNQANCIITPATTANSGMYSVVVIDSNQCKNNNNVFVQVNPLPAASIMSNSPVFEFQDIELSSNAATAWSWIGPGNFSATGQYISIPNATETDEGFYTVWVTDNNGCSDSASTWVEVLSQLVFPNVITPNNDGHNDVFLIKNNIGIHNQLILFNRWGNEIFSMIDYDNTWNADHITDGVYYYIFQYGNSLEYEHHGTISVLR